MSHAVAQRPKRDGWAASYADKIIARFEADVFPSIGKQPIGSITAPQLLEVLRRIEGRGVVETAHRALQDSGQVFRYAVATGKAASNPARDLKDALRRPDPNHFPAIIEPKRFGDLLRACDTYAATPQAVAALRELHTLTGSGPMVFRGERHHDRAMSENTINAAQRK